MRKSAEIALENLHRYADSGGDQLCSDLHETTAPVTPLRKPGHGRKASPGKRAPKAKAAVDNQESTADGGKIRRGRVPSDTHDSGAATPGQPLGCATGEEGHGRTDTQKSSADLATTCQTLKGLQVRRRFLIRSKDRNRLALGSLIRRHLGWTPDLPEKDRKRIAKEAAAMMETALEPGSMGESWIAEMAFVTEASCKPFDDMLSSVEKAMLTFVKDVPKSALDYVDSVKGFGRKTLAIIIGEAGDLHNYANPGKLWKRLGLAPKTDYPMSDGGKHMVPRQRRSQVWACLGASLLRGNDGAYREAYNRKKEEYLAREWTKGHAHLAAHRYMEKLAIKHLWRTWRGHKIDDTQTSSAPPTNT